MKQYHWRTVAIDLACLIGGSVLYAVSVVMFSAPNRATPHLCSFRLLPSRPKYAYGIFAASLQGGGMEVIA